MIKSIQIETTNACPNKCAFCPHGLIEGTKNMDMNLFKKIVDEIVTLGVEKVAPFQNGEPFADELIFERLDYIKEKMPDMPIEIFTNAVLLDKEKIERLKDYKIGLFNISVNAASKETYMKVCGIDNYDIVMQNTIDCIDILKEAQVRVSIVPCPQVGDDIEKFKEYWKDYDVEVQVNEYFNWEGKIFEPKETLLKPCARILEQLNIQSDGKVIWCCMDIGENIIGDLTKQSIKEVWDKSEWRRIMHLHGKRPCLEPCFRCQNRT